MHHHGFPGKPLALIGNKPMIQRVYEQASKSLDLVYVATDDKRIFDAVMNFGGKAVMTSPDHQSGTDRCAEAVTDIMQEKPVKKLILLLIFRVMNHLLNLNRSILLMECFSDENVEIATLVRKAEPGEDIFNPNQPKVIIELRR